MLISEVGKKDLAKSHLYHILRYFIALKRQNTITLLVLYEVQGFIYDVVFHWSSNKEAKCSCLMKTGHTDIRLNLILFT